MVFLLQTVESWMGFINGTRVDRVWLPAGTYFDCWYRHGDWVYLYDDEPDPLVFSVRAESSILS